MRDQLIDATQVEMLVEEIRRNPMNDDERARELITLYKFQLHLIRQWENEVNWGV